jgi:hypothetical protein
MAKVYDLWECPVCCDIQMVWVEDDMIVPPVCERCSAKGFGTIYMEET